jgi:2-polyprenyl-6-methoxyphenol hydroxylase-like FAD-dependent oxidoreductase
MGARVDKLRSGDPESAARGHRGREPGPPRTALRRAAGAGATLALEDAIALADALRASPQPLGGDAELGSALARYERERRSALLSVQSAARYSAQWYENLPRWLGPRVARTLVGFARPQVR